jgi:two-component system chemotaxis response regulator CheB
VLGPLRQGYVLPIIVVCCTCRKSRRSQLAEVFARRLMLVEEATDKQDIAPGTVYFATPGYHLSVEQDAACR